MKWVYGIPLLVMARGEYGPEEMSGTGMKKTPFLRKAQPLFIDLQHFPVDDRGIQ